MTITNLYFIWLIISIGNTAEILAWTGLLSFLIFVGFLSASCDYRDIEEESMIRIKKTGKAILMVTSIFVFIATVIPSKKDAAMIAGINVVTTDPTALKGKDVLNKIMDEYLKEEEKK